jgi:hypothetical protein
MGFLFIHCAWRGILNTLIFGFRQFIKANIDVAEAIIDAIGIARAPFVKDGIVQ